MVEKSGDMWTRCTLYVFMWSFGLFGIFSLAKWTQNLDFQSTILQYVHLNKTRTFDPDYYLEVSFDH